jgi:hypothetical protein
MRVLMTALLMGGAAASLGAQSAVTIDSGMTREQVVAKLGEPMSVRSYEGHTYLYYKNGCEKTCGMSDLIVLDSGKVVDAVFRAPSRHYSGTSSSPRMISMAEAKRASGSEVPLALPAGEPSVKDSTKPADTAAAKPAKSDEKKAAPAPKKTSAKSASGSGNKSPKTSKPLATNLPTVTTPRVEGLAKTPPSAPAKTVAAPEKKTEPAPVDKKPDASAAKKDSTKQPPAKPPAGDEN